MALTSLLLAGVYAALASGLLRDGIAPVVAVQGNVDAGTPLARRFPTTQRLTIEGVAIYMTHVGGRPADLARALPQPRPDVYIFGHSHAALLVTGYVTAAGWLGGVALRAIHTDAHPVVALLSGLLLIGLALLVPIVGALVGFAAVVIGTGAVALSAYVAYRGTRAAAPSGENQPPAPLRAAA